MPLDMCIYLQYIVKFFISHNLRKYSVSLGDFFSEGKIQQICFVLRADVTVVYIYGTLGLESIQKGFLCTGKVGHLERILCACRSLF